MSSTDKAKKKQDSFMKKTPPGWLNEEERKHWLVIPEWRSAFENEQKHLIKTTIRRFSLINIIVVIASLILTVINGKTNFDLLLKPTTLISMANISCTVAAAVTAIVLAFIVFLFGHAKRLEEDSRNNITFDIRSIEAVRIQIAEFTHAEVRKTASKYGMEKKAQNLVDAAKKFDNALHELTRQFAFAMKHGSHCDDDYLSLLNDHIFVRAGDWFVAYLHFWESVRFQLSDREFARSVMQDAENAAKNLCRLNENIEESARMKHNKVSQPSLTIPSFLLIVVVSLLTIIVADKLSTRDGIYQLLVTWIAITLIALLTTHLISLIYGITRFIQREMIIRAANRQAYLKYATKYKRVNKYVCSKDSLHLLKAHPDFTEIVQELEDRLRSDTK